MTFHLEVTLGLSLLPFGARREVQARRLVGFAADIPSADNGVAIRNREIQQASRLKIGEIMLVRDLSNELINSGNGLHHDSTQQSLSKPFRARIRTRIYTFFLQQIEEQCKGPLAVCATLDTKIPLIGERAAQCPLDVVPAADAAIVHPHQSLVLERVAVILRESTLGGGADMSKDKVRASLRS